MATNAFSNMNVQPSAMQVAQNIPQPPPSSPNYGAAAYQPNPIAQGYPMAPGYPPNPNAMMAQGCLILTTMPRRFRCSRRRCRLPPWPKPTFPSRMAERPCPTLTQRKRSTLCSRRNIIQCRHPRGQRTPPWMGGPLRRAPRPAPSWCKCSRCSANRRIPHTRMGLQHAGHL